MTTKRLLQTQEIKEKELISTSHYSPQRCKIDLQQFLESRKNLQADTEFLCNAMTNCNLTPYDNFAQNIVVRTKALKSLKWVQIPPEKQLLLCKKIAEVGNLHEIELAGCSALTDSVLDSLLRNCPQLTALSIDQEKVPRKVNVISLLKKHRLNDTIQLLSLISDSGVKVIDCQFPSLKILQLKSCAIAALNLEAEVLEVCVLDDLPLLASFTMPFLENLRELKLASCLLLETEKLLPICRLAFELTAKHLHVDKCPLLDRHKLDSEFNSHRHIAKWLREGEDCMGAFEYVPALLKFNKVLAIEPNSVAALIRKSCVLYSKGKFSESFSTANYLTNYIASPKEIETLFQQEIRRAKLAWHQASQGQNEPSLRSSSYFSLWIVISLLYCRSLIIQQRQHEALEGISFFSCIIYYLFIFYSFICFLDLLFVFVIFAAFSFLDCLDPIYFHCYFGLIFRIGKSQGVD
jgi:hypothetical protein